MRPLLAVAGWIAAASAAIGIGLAGVQTIGNRITDETGNDVLTADQAARELAAAGPAPSGSPSVPSVPPPGPPSVSSSALPDGAANVRVFGGTGGTVRAGCLPGGAVLVTWTPAQGYSVKEYRQGPGEYAEVRFDRNGGNSGKGNGESRVRIRCDAGSPVGSWS
jgi:hypothetical protein